MKLWIKNHKYSLALLYFVFYYIAFFWLEKFAKPIIYIHCALDDKIKFLGWFVIPYFLWFLIVPGALVYFMLKNKEDFMNLCFLMFTGMTICLLIYFVFPNGHRLRGIIPDNGIFCDIMRFVYSIDPPINVCPSIHVSSTTAIYMVIHRSETFRYHTIVKFISLLTTVFICLSTVFLRMHSVIDVFFGFLLSAILCSITYGYDWQKIMKKTPLSFLWD